MKVWRVSGYITVPVYQVVQGETEDDAFDSFVEMIKQEHAYDEQDVEAYVHAIVIYTAYLQGIKDGQAQLTLDLEKFNKSRERYLGKKKNSKFAGTLLNHIKED